MWLIIQQDKPDDYVVGTGTTHTVEEFLKKAFEVLDLNYKKYLLVDKNLFRPSEVNILHSNPNKIKKKLAWKPKTTFEELVTEMVLFDYNNEKNMIS